MNRTDDGRRTFLKTAGALGAAGLAAGAAPPMTLAASTTAGPMPTRALGRTGEQVPILHLGTSQDLDAKYDKVMHRSHALGVTWFDTALSYGWGASHAAINTFLGQMGERRSMWLTSKSGSRDPSRLMSDADEALDQLGTDYLDLYLMHGVSDIDMLGPRFLEVGDKLRRSGKTRFFGLSCHSSNVVALMERAAEVGGIDAILFRYNFRRYGDRELNNAIDRCHRAGIGLLAMKTMGSVPRDLESVVEFKSRQFTLGQAKLKSVWADERIASICSEMDNVRRVRENVAAAKSEVELTASEAHQLNQLSHLTANHACVGCSHLCEHAAGNTVAIEAPLRYLMYHDCYGKPDRARALYRELAPDPAMPDAEALAAASAACPQGIDIARALERARSVLA